MAEKCACPLGRAGSPHPTTPLEIVNRDPPDADVSLRRSASPARDLASAGTLDGIPSHGSNRLACKNPVFEVGETRSIDVPAIVGTVCRKGYRLMSSPDDALLAALSQYQVELPAAQVDLLRQYCELLWQWNAKLNLTRHTDYEKFVGRDLLDSMAFAKFLAPNEKVLDVGTGGGVPGVVLAILRPDLVVWLCDSVGKKAMAVADIVAQLHLNVPVIHGRAQDLLGPSVFNSLVVRAVGPLKEVLLWLRPHWEHFDRLLVLKGPKWIDERGEARHYGLLRDLALRKLTSYPMPGTESESVLLQLCPKDRLTGEKSCRMTPLA